MVGFLRSLGCACYARNRLRQDVQDGKMADRATPGVIVGYSRDLSQYLVYHWHSRRVLGYEMGLVHCLESIFPYCLNRLPALTPYSSSDLLLRVPRAVDSDLVDMGGRSPVYVLEDESDAVGAGYDQVPEDLPGDWIFWDEPFQLDLKDAELTPVSLHEQARSEVVARDQPESRPLTSAPQAHSE